MIFLFFGAFVWFHHEKIWVNLAEVVPLACIHAKYENKEDLPVAFDDACEYIAIYLIGLISSLYL